MYAHAIVLCASRRLEVGLYRKGHVRGGVPCYKQNVASMQCKMQLTLGQPAPRYRQCYVSKYAYA